MISKKSFQPWNWATLACASVVVFCSAGFAEHARPTLIFSVTNNVLEAGTRAYVTLNALNSSPGEIKWTAPSTLEAEVQRGQLNPSVVLEAAPKSERSFVLAPGTFAMVEYSFAVPTLSTNRMLLAIQSEPPANLFFRVTPRDETPEVPTTTGSRIVNMLRDVAPEGSPEGFDPTRFFKDHISGYEPFYFVAGTESPNAKFQISFKYQLLNRNGYLGHRWEKLQGFHIAYTQTSLWDWDADSAPFFDSSYKPEVLYVWEKVLGGEPEQKYRLDAQAGLQHESNGKGGADSRSLNIAYIRPTLIIGGDKDLQLTLQPRAWVYLGDLEGNPDIADYRGYADLRAIVGWRRGLQLSTTVRAGDSFDKGSLQLDLTYPLMRFFYSNFSMYLHAQYFTGYGESLVRYDEKSSMFRLGISMYR